MRVCSSLANLPVLLLEMFAIPLPVHRECVTATYGVSQRRFSKSVFKLVLADWLLVFARFCVLFCFWPPIHICMLLLGCENKHFSTCANK